MLYCPEFQLDETLYDINLSSFLEFNSSQIPWIFNLPDDLD